MGTISGPFSIPDGLIYHIDPANPKSYIGTGTTIYDLSGNGNTSYFTNGALYQNYQKGVVLVDGNNDYISTPLFNLTSPITVSAWVKNIADDAPVFSASGAGVNFGNDEVIHYFSGKSILICGNPAPGKYFQFPQLNLNQWSHLVMTRDASNNMSVYLNGVGSTSNTQSFSNTLQMNQIGRYSAFTNIYNAKGSIGEVKIYNRVLSASEVLQNYNASKKRYVPEENIVSNGLVLNLDAANPSSYAGSGNTIYDLSGAGNTGSLINGPTFSGLNGGTIVFDGTNDYINIPRAGLVYGSGPKTLMAWAKLSSYVDGVQVIASYGSGPNATFFISVYRLTGQSGGYNNDLFGGTVTLNTWFHICNVYDGTTAYLYFNGVLMTSGAKPWNVTSTTYDGKIGAQIEPQQYFNGNISQVQLYNRALSAQEILQNYNAMKNRFPV